MGIPKVAPQLPPVTNHCGHRTDLDYFEKLNLILCICAKCGSTSALNAGSTRSDSSAFGASASFMSRIVPNRTWPSSRSHLTRLSLPDEVVLHMV